MIKFTLPVDTKITGFVSIEHCEKEKLKYAEKILRKLLYCDACEGSGFSPSHVEPGPCYTCDGYGHRFINEDDLSLDDVVAMALEDGYARD